MTEQKDYWTKDNSIFVCDGWKYGIAPDGSTVCVGSVSGVNQTIPVQEKPVTNPQLEGNLSAQETAEVLLQKNKGGRPRKAGGEPVSRMTEWRREKRSRGCCCECSGISPS